MQEVELLLWSLLCAYDHLGQVILWKRSRAPCSVLFFWLGKRLHFNKGEKKQRNPAIFFLHESMEWDNPRPCLQARGGASSSPKGHHTKDQGQPTICSDVHTQSQSKWAALTQSLACGRKPSYPERTTSSTRGFRPSSVTALTAVRTHCVITSVSPLQFGLCLFVIITALFSFSFYILCIFSVVWVFFFPVWVMHSCTRCVEFPKRCL